MSSPDLLLDILQTIPALARLAPPDLDALKFALILESNPAGHVYLIEGKRGSEAFLLLAGEVAVTHQRPDSHRVDQLNRIVPGQFFGLLSLVDEGHRSATCTGVGPTQAARLNRSAFRLLFNAQAPVAYAMQRTIADQLAQTFRHLDGEIRKELARTP